MLHAWLVSAVLLGANSYLEEGTRAYERFDLPQAEARLRMALESAELPDDERRQAVELLALTLAAQGRMAEVEKVFSSFLVRFPSAPPPENAAPKVRAAFLRAKEQLYPPRYFRMEQLPSPGERLSVSVVDPWAMLGALHWTDAAGARLRLLGEGDRFTLQPRPEGEGTLVAVDREQQELARLEVPARQRAPDPTLLPAPPAATVEATPPRWPRWTASIAAVTLAGVGTYLAVSSQADGAQAHAAYWASDSDAYFRSAGNKALASRIVFGVSVVVAGGATWLWLDP